MGQGGFAVLNGAQGGLSGNTLNFTNSFGGFGGGGGGGGNSQVIISNGAGGGGGGGYSGGGAGSRSGLGAGGGGSYVPLGQTMTQIGYCTSNGYVSINYLAPVAVKLTGTPLFTQLSPSATSSAVGAFSLRAVNGTSTRAVQVRNGTTSAVQDFYADRLGNLLTAPVVGQTLQNWLGGATGYVTTWYDQSGKGNHASQATAANQPVIQRATKGAGYSCLFNGSRRLDGMSYTVLNGTNYSVVINERRTTSTVNNYYIGSGNSSLNQDLILGYRYDNTLTHAQWGNDYDMTVPVYAGSSEPMRYTSYTFSSTNGKFIYNNGSLLGSLTDANGKTGLSSTSGNFAIGYGYGSNYYTGEIYELIVFTQSLYDLDTSGGLITNIYNNQLSAYGT
jgi:hypothetical protein